MKSKPRELTANLPTGCGKGWGVRLLNSAGNPDQKTFHFVQKMNKVVLKKCDNAAMKKIGARIVSVEDGKLIPPAFRVGWLRRLRPCPLMAEKTEIHFVQSLHKVA